MVSLKRDFFYDMIKKIAIQGIKGSFHYQAATEYFGKEIEVMECDRFDQLADNLVQQTSDMGVMALENTIAGSILPNYALIDHLNLHIIGEHYIDVQQNLMALSGQQIEDIQEVHSHPMALQQCKHFFRSYPHIKLVEDIDTAETARRIHQKQLKGIAAIASKSAAELYDLQILAESIQTMEANFTRFVIVKNKNEKLPKKDINKASLKFEVNHQRGSLAAVLNVISDCNINMTKIQSLPVIETPWKYAFFVDILFEQYADFEKATKLLAIMADHFKVLGEYKNTLV